MPCVYLLFTNQSNNLKLTFGVLNQFTKNNHFFALQFLMTFYTISSFDLVEFNVFKYACDAFHRLTFYLVARFDATFYMNNHCLCA